MSSDPNAQPASVPAAEALQVFALVIYIPAPLGRFLDRLRRELAPQDDPQAHISLLPPRPISGDWRRAWTEVRETLRARAAFDVELTRIQTFPATDVVYLEVGSGSAELRAIHAAMNANSLAFREPFAYHPHVTLAQDILHQDVDRVLTLAKRRWDEFRGKRSFRAQRAVFVRNSVGDRWLDLAEYRLGSRPR